MTDPKDLNTLKEQQSELRELRIRRDTAATRLLFALTGGSRIEIGQESVTGSGDRLLTKTTHVTLPGLGQLDITPGGADLAELGRQEQALADSHAALLQRLGLASLEAAEVRHQSHTQNQAEARTATATLKALAPKGIEALRAEQAGHDARAGEIEQALARLPVALGKAAEPAPVSQAEAPEETARQSLDQINQQLNEARIAVGNAQTAHESAARELAAAQAVLDAPDRAARLSAANQNLVDARAEQDSLAERIEARARQVAEANPDILQQDVERFRTSAGQLEKQHAERRDTLMRLEVELQTTGAQGLEERRAETARDQEQVRRRGDELQRRALALDQPTFPACHAEDAGGGNLARPDLRHSGWGGESCPQSPASTRNIQLRCSFWASRAGLIGEPSRKIWRGCRVSGGSEATAALSRTPPNE